MHKAEHKSRSKEEVNQVISWLTGYDSAGLERAIASEVDFETFFAEAPEINPHAVLIKGVICGHRVEEIEDPLMRKIRYMDKLVDELARGKKMTAILRDGGADSKTQKCPRPDALPRNGALRVLRTERDVAHATSASTAAGGCVWCQPHSTRSVPDPVGSRRWTRRLGRRAQLAALG